MFTNLTYDEGAVARIRHNKDLKDVLLLKVLN